MASKRVLITGGTGMIALNLVNRLGSRSKEKIVLTHRATSYLDPLDELDVPCERLEMDLDDPLRVEEVISRVRPDVVYHLASTIWSQVHPDESDRHYRTNVLGTQAILEAMRRFCPTARLVFTGSSAAVGAGVGLREDDLPAPNTVYGASKAAVSVLLQTYARLYALHTVELRLFTPYGPYENAGRLIPYVIGRLMAGSDVELTSGVQQRDFVFVDDVVEALVLAADCDIPKGEVINIAGGQGVAVREVAEELLRISGRSDVRLCLGAVQQRQDEMFQMSANIEKAEKLIGWRPEVSLRDGLRRCWQWYQRRPPRRDD